MRSEREKGGDHAPGDSKGRSPWRAFGDFPRDGKVTRGRRGGAPSPLRVEAKSGDLLRELCSHIGERRGAYAPSLNRWVPSCSCLMGMASPGARSRSSSERQMPKISMSPGCRSLSSISQTSWV